MLGTADTARGKSTKELEAAEALQALFDDVKEKENNIDSSLIEKELADVPAAVDEISIQNEKSTNTETETSECSTQVS